MITNSFVGDRLRAQSGYGDGSRLNVLGSALCRNHNLLQHVGSRVSRLRLGTLGALGIELTESGGDCEQRAGSADRCGHVEYPLLLASSEAGRVIWRISALCTGLCATPMQPGASAHRYENVWGAYLFFKQNLCCAFYGDSRRRPDRPALMETGAIFPVAGRPFPISTDPIAAPGGGLRGCYNAKVRKRIRALIR